MPPIPRPSLTTEASDLLDSLERRARFVKEDLLQQLNSLASATPSKEVSSSYPPGLHGHQRLSDDIREELGILARELDQLGLMVDDQPGAAARKELNMIVDHWGTRLNELRAASRSSIITAKRTLDAQKATSNRSELFTGARGPGASSTEAGDPSSQNLESASQNLTLGLQRLMTSMQQELQTSTLSTQLLTSSTATLAAASNQHDTLTTAMDTAKQLVGALEKADWLDRLLILGAFTFFLLVVLFVVGQRTVGRGLRLMWWLTGGLRSSSSIQDNLRRAAEEKASQVAAVKASIKLAETASVLSVAVSSISAMASISSAIKSGSQVPEPSPTLASGDGKVSEILESVVPPASEPSSVPHDEL